MGNNRWRRVHSYTVDGWRRCITTIDVSIIDRNGFSTGCIPGDRDGIVGQASTGGYYTAVHVPGIVCLTGFSGIYITGRILTYRSRPVMVGDAPTALTTVAEVAPAHPFASV